MISAKIVALSGLLSLASARITQRATRTTTTISTTTYTPPPVATVAQWGQCGGIGFTGGTVCTTDWVCTYQNAFHSQCLPGPNYTPPPRPTTSSTTTSVYPVQTWDYVFSFGDSWTETGFDLKGTKPAVGNQLGNPAYPGLTTSGGPNWVSDIVTDNSQLLSYNFASGGATIDAGLVTPEVTSARSLVNQVTEFTSNLVPPPAYAPWVQSNSLFVIWIGNTDVAIAWDQPDWSTLCQKIIDSYFEQVQLLYNAGARSFLFMEIPPIQRTPAMLLQSVAKQQAMAAAIAQFNNLLSAETDSLVRTKLGGYFPTPDGFAQVVATQLAFSVMLDNPTAYGAPNASCYNANGVSCLWTDEWNPGQQLQSIIETYVSVTVGLYSS